MNDHTANSPVRPPGDVTYSVILPVFNEEECLPETLSRLEKVLGGLGGPYEIICVDDGSRDRSWAIVEEAAERNSAVRGIRFQRNFGHQNAVFAGIRQCRGEFIVIMDADGQDPPEILPRFFDKCREGYDVVFAVRTNRKENALLRLCYTVFYRLYRFIVPFDVPLDSGDFTVFRRPVGDFLGSLSEKRPFIRGLRSWYGGRQTGIPYERAARAAGRPKYNLYKLFLLAVNGSISFSRAPLRAIALLGLFISIGSFLGGIYILALKLFVGISLSGWTSTVILVIFFGGLNLLVLGIISEYIGDIFDEVKNRPQYLVKEVVGMD